MPRLNAINVGPSLLASGSAYLHRVHHSRQTNAEEIVVIRFKIDGVRTDGYFLFVFFSSRGSVIRDRRHHFHASHFWSISKKSDHREGRASIFIEGG